MSSVLAATSWVNQGKTLARSGTQALPPIAKRGDVAFDISTDPVKRARQEAAAMRIQTVYRGNKARDKLRQQQDAELARRGRALCLEIVRLASVGHLAHSP